MKKVIAALLIACTISVLVPPSVAAQSAPDPAGFESYVQTTVFAQGGQAAACQAIGYQISIAYAMISYLSSLGMGIMTGSPVFAGEIMSWYVFVGVLTGMWYAYGC